MTKNSKRSDWRIGKSTDLTDSEDKQIRAAKLQLVNKGKIIITSIPVNKLFPFRNTISRYDVIPWSAEGVLPIDFIYLNFQAEIRDLMNLFNRDFVN